MFILSRLNQLSSYANPAASATHATFEHVTNAQFASDLLDIDGLAFVGKRGISGYDEERLKLRQTGNDVFDDSVREVFLLGIATHVLERQNGDGRLVWKGKQLSSIG